VRIISVSPCFYYEAVFKACERLVSFSWINSSRETINGSGETQENRSATLHHKEGEKVATVYKNVAKMQQKSE